MSVLCYIYCFVYIVASIRVIYISSCTQFCSIHSVCVCMCGNFFFTSCSRCAFALFVRYRPIRNECNHYSTNNWNISHCIYCVWILCIRVWYVILKTKRLKLIHTKPQSKWSCGNEWILLKWFRQWHTTQHITIQYNTIPLRISAYTQYIHYFNEILSISISLPFALLNSCFFKWMSIL